MQTIRKLIACAVAVGALAGVTTPQAYAQTQETEVETQGWCDIVPRFCCNVGGGNDTQTTGGRCKPL